MTRNSEEPLTEFDLELERTLHLRRRVNRQLNMVENQNNLLEGDGNNNGARDAQTIRTIRDYAMPSLEGASPNILKTCCNTWKSFAFNMCRSPLIRSHGHLNSVSI